MTLKEIADQVGVSVSTVSRVINKKGAKVARPEIQDKIWEIVRSSGYTPNDQARALKLGCKNTSANTIACLFARSTDSVSDPFFSKIARSIEENAQMKNHVVKYTFSAVDFQNQTTLSNIKDNNVSGVAILGRCNPRLLSLLKQYFGNVVYTGLNKLNANYDQIICDGAEASKTAVNYLIGLGHTRIGYIGEVYNEERYVGYRAALLENNITPNPNWTIDVLLSSEGGYNGAGKLLNMREKPSAIFCANDITSFGVIRRLAEMGISVPGDISIISIDDIDTSKYISPALTTVHIPVEEMGSVTTKVLIDRIEGGHKLPMKILLPFKIIERESCCRYVEK